MARKAATARAHEVVVAYHKAHISESTMPPVSAYDRENAIVRLLADFRTYCRDECIDFQKILRGLTQ